MTRDERIDKARWAMLTAKCKCGRVGEGGACSRCKAEAALDAADVEGMVREAVIAGWEYGYYRAGDERAMDEMKSAFDEIVRRVCGE